MKIKKGKCSIGADVTVRTTYDNGKTKRGKFEKQIEDILQSCYLAYIKHLCSRLPDADQYEWKQVRKTIFELNRKEVKS